MTGVTRSDLLRRALVAGAVATTGGALAAATASAADSDEDTVWVRLGVSLEFLGVVFYRRAIRSALLSEPREARTLIRGRAAEQGHLDRFVATLAEQGRTSIDGRDLEIEFPEGAFGSRAGISALGTRLGLLSQRTYLGAAATVASPTLRILFSQVASSAGEQVAFFRGLRGAAIGDPLPYGYDIARASAELAPYLP